MIDGIDRNFQNITAVKDPIVKKLGGINPDRKKSGSNKNSHDDKDSSNTKKSELLSKIYGENGQIEAFHSNDNHFIDLNV